MTLRSVRIGWLLLSSLGVLFLLAQARKSGPVAKYVFDEISGSRVADSSGNHNDGAIVGAARWTGGIRGKAVVFDGLNRISIPSSPTLNLTHEATVIVWIQGRASKFRIVRERGTYSSVRGPFFQVCGDTIHFTMNSDHASSENPKLSDDPVLKKHSDFPWNDWHLWTGTVDINLTNWRDKQRTKFPYTACEPKLQVVNDRIYYEYFGQDQNRAWQIWTAQSKPTVPIGKPCNALSKRKAIGPSRKGIIKSQTARFTTGWMQMDAKNDWQLWTAISNLDGSNFRATQRTTDGGGIPNVQVAGDTVYYMYVKRYRVDDPTHKRNRETLYFAVSDKNGEGWRVIRAIEDAMPQGWRAFQVSKGKIYFSYGALDSRNVLRLFTARWTPMVPASKLSSGLLARRRPGREN